MQVKFSVRIDFKDGQFTEVIINKWSQLDIYSPESIADVMLLEIIEND
jgi:hypothetical protein